MLIYTNRNPNIHFNADQFNENSTEKYPDWVDKKGRYVNEQRPEYRLSDFFWKGTSEYLKTFEYLMKYVVCYTISLVRLWKLMLQGERKHRIKHQQQYQPNSSENMKYEETCNKRVINMNEHGFECV